MNFRWDAENEIGYYPVSDTWYNNGYFEASKRNAESPIAEALNQFRIGLVNTHVGEHSFVLDYGAGYGHFVFGRDFTLGYDIGEKSVWKLWKNGRFFDPYSEDMTKKNIKAVTFFDVIEHMRDPILILRRIKDQIVFISLPIFRDKNHILTSKHFKTNEHFWYFTDKAIKQYMGEQGFLFLDRRDDETKIGREDIKTYVFKRR